MALRKHIVQLKLAKSGMHCARLYSFCDGVRGSTCVANFLSVLDCLAKLYKMPITKLSKLPRSRNDEEMFFESFTCVPGTMLLK